MKRAQFLLGLAALLLAGDGCFNEQGHNKLMLVAQERGRPEAIVHVEYPPDLRDGVPLISVGRHFRRWN